MVKVDGARRASKDEGYDAQEGAAAEAETEEKTEKDQESKKEAPVVDMPFGDEVKGIEKGEDLTASGIKGSTAKRDKVIEVCTRWRIT